MEYKYTKHQTVRGARPDDESSDKITLIKNVSEMRATYQVKMLAYMAHKKGKKLVLRLPKKTKLHSSLKDLKQNLSGIIKIERV